MKVFFSWLGDISKQVVFVFYVWFFMVIQIVKFYMFVENIDKGECWSVDIVKQFEECYFGIVCVILENKDVFWILFEVGVLLKSMEKVCVLLLVFGVLVFDFINSLLL